MDKSDLKENVFYPAAFLIDKDDPEWIAVTFPDIVAGHTCGKGMVDAILMAEDLLALMIKEAPHQCFKPSSLEEIKAFCPDAKYVLFIEPHVHPREEIERIIEEVGDDIETFISQKSRQKPSIS